MSKTVSELLVGVLQQVGVKSKQPVEFDDIVDALRRLEKGPPPKWKRVVGRDRSGSNETPNGGMSFSA
jgi:hypothetical protein